MLLWSRLDIIAYLLLPFYTDGNFEDKRAGSGRLERLFLYYIMKGLI